MKDQKTIDGKKASDIQKENWKEIEDSGYFEFKEFGDTIEGKLLSKGVSKKYNVGMYTLELPTKETKRFLGKTQLDQRMDRVNIGDYIKITYIDTVGTPMGDMKIFEVLKRER